MERALELISEYGYLLVFFGTVIDQSGIPVFIVAGGIFVAAGLLGFWPVMLLSILALVVTDIPFIFIGRYLSRRLVGNYSTGKSVRWLKNFLIVGTAIFLKSPTLFYLFSKVIPVIGKYVPVFASFSSSRKARAVLLFSLGDVVYALVFTIGGVYLGDLFIEYSRVLAVVIALLFAVFYLLAARIYGKRIKSRMGKERSDYR